jgi:isopentenyldiphosphate isomerase
MSKIAIVSKDDRILGSEERKIVYQKGLIHRLVRVLLFNDRDEVLLQWRSANEDTFPSTWDQSAGGHVDEGEDYDTAAKRELAEELGVKDIKLKLVDKFYTDSQIGEKIIRRFNAVFVGDYSGEFILQKEEVEKVKWFNFVDLMKEVEEKSKNFTPGLISILSNEKIIAVHEAHNRKVGKL